MQTWGWTRIWGEESVLCIDIDNIIDYLFLSYFKFKAVSKRSIEKQQQVKGGKPKTYVFKKRETYGDAAPEVNYITNEIVDSPEDKRAMLAWYFIIFKIKLCFITSVVLVLEWYFA